MRWRIQRPVIYRCLSSHLYRLNWILSSRDIKPGDTCRSFIKDRQNEGRVKGRLVPYGTIELAQVAPSSPRQRSFWAYVQVYTVLLSAMVHLLRDGPFHSIGKQANFNHSNPFSDHQKSYSNTLESWWSSKITDEKYVCIDKETNWWVCYT